MSIEISGHFASSWSGEYYLAQTNVFSISEAALGFFFFHSRTTILFIPDLQTIHFPVVSLTYTLVLTIRHEWAHI